MASGYTTTTQLTELIPEITERVDYIFQNRAIGRQLVNYRDVSGVPGNVVEFSRFTEVSASTGVAETGTPTSHAMDLSVSSLTLARRSVYVLWGDLARASANVSGAEIGTAMGMAMVKAIDASVFGVVSTTNYATSAGSTDQAMGMAYVVDAINVLEENEADLPFNIVLHPHQYNTIRDALVPVANDDAISTPVSDAMNVDGFVSRALGLNWYVTNRVSSRTVDATANCWSGLVFKPEGIGFGYKTLYESGVEAERDAATASTKLIMNWADSAGVIYASGVCTLYSTSS